MLKKLYSWMGKKVNSQYANHALGVLFFLEAIFFLPTDPMLIVYCLEKRKKAFSFATIATFSSVAGGITGYFIGYFLWQTIGAQIFTYKIINFILPYKTFLYLKAQYLKYANWAIFIAGFTPVPYKAATLSAGFCKLPLSSFIIFSALSRGARFYFYAITISIWGKQMKKYIDQYFNLLVTLVVIIIFAVIWLLQ